MSGGSRQAVHLPPPPNHFQSTLIFDDGIFAILLTFSSRTSKFRHSLTKKVQLLEAKTAEAVPGLYPCTPLGTGVSDPLGTRLPFAHSKHATALRRLYMCISMCRQTSFVYGRLREFHQSYDANNVHFH